MSHQDVGRIGTRAAVTIAEAERGGRRVVGWRVSKDIRDELMREPAAHFSGPAVHDFPEFMRQPFRIGTGDSLFGAPLTMDPVLPPSSIIAVLGALGQRDTGEPPA